MESLPSPRPSRLRSLAGLLFLTFLTMCGGITAIIGYAANNQIYAASCGSPLGINSWVFGGSVLAIIIFVLMGVAFCACKVCGCCCAGGAKREPGAALTWGECVGKILTHDALMPVTLLCWAVLFAYVMVGISVVKSAIEGAAACNADYLLYARVALAVLAVLLVAGVVLIIIECLCATCVAMCTGCCVRGESSSKAVEALPGSGAAMAAASATGTGVPATVTGTGVPATVTIPRAASPGIGAAPNLV